MRRIASQVGMDRKLIGAVISVIIAMIALPIALAEAAGAEAANWGSGGVALLGILGIVAAAGVVLFLYRALT